MTQKHILPEEIRRIIDKLVRAGQGQESEGSYPAGVIEQKLRDGEISSDFFGEHFPSIKPGLKAQIGIEMLYEAAFSKLGLRLNIPYRLTDDSNDTQYMTIKDHLDQLLKLWEIIHKVKLMGSPLRID